MTSISSFRSHKCSVNVVNVSYTHHCKLSHGLKDSHIVGHDLVVDEELQIMPTPTDTQTVYNHTYTCNQNTAI